MRNPIPGEGPNPSGLCFCGCGQRTPLASSGRSESGDVKGKPLRYVHGHYQRRDPLRDFVVEDRGYKTPCYIWTGSVSKVLGYGVYAHRYAHLIAYEAAYGPVPPGRVIHHRCEQKLCIRKEHLEVTTRPEHPARHVKIDAKLWDEIRAATGSTRQIAAQFGIPKTHAWMVRSGKQPRPIQ